MIRRESSVGRVKWFQNTNFTLCRFRIDCAYHHSLENVNVSVEEKKITEIQRILSKTVEKINTLEFEMHQENKKITLFKKSLKIIAKR